jgi:hypothetical protein
MSNRPAGAFATSPVSAQCGLRCFRPSLSNARLTSLPRFLSICSLRMNFVSVSFQQYVREPKAPSQAKTTFRRTPLHLLRSQPLHLFESQISIWIGRMPIGTSSSNPDYCQMEMKCLSCIVDGLNSCLFPPENAFGLFLLSQEGRPCDASHSISSLSEASTRLLRM